MTYPIQLIDTFASGPFTGNPAAVLLLRGPLDEDVMGLVAMELNQAETAFVWPHATPESEFSLRWFTPTVEVDLCGHATLAAAHALFTGGAQGTLTFGTNSGVLSAELLGDGIALDFPSEPPTESPLPFPLPFLGEVLWSGRNRMDWFVQLRDEAAVRMVVPDFAAIERLGMRGLIVTAAGAEHDFVSRFFAPQSGVNEDPVTGSAHCALAPFWAERLGKGVLTGYQASKRGGAVHTTVLGDRIRLAGKAVTTLSGELQI